MNKMRRLHTLMAGMLVTLAGFAQALPEGFETLDLDTGGWIATQAQGAAANHKWSISSYAAETAQFPTNIPKMEICGEKVLKSTTSGAMVVTGVAPDNRLVSPEIAIADKPYLSFLMACNFGGNAAANVTDASKTRVSVIVSPTGSSATEAFTDTVYVAAPSGLNTWMPVSIDLSAYKGKSIRLQFRCHMNELFKSLIANTLYIDNIELSSKKSTDLKLANLTGLYKGTVTGQTVGVDIINNGSTTVGSHSLTAKVNDKTVLSETFSRTLEPGEKYTYNFDVTLSPGNNTVTVEASAADDCIGFNNTVSGSTIIETGVDLPFTLATDGTQETQFVSTRKGTTSKPAGWMYFTNYSQWFHTTSATGAKAYLYTAKPLKIEKGAIKIDVKGTLAVAASAEFEVFLTRRPDQFGDIRNSVTLTTDNNEKMMLVNVPEDGDYYVAFGVTDNVVNAQFKLDGLTISRAVDIPDLEIAGVTSPLFALSGESVPLSVEIRNGGSGIAADPKITYSVGETSVTETIPSIEGGATTVHTFEQPVTLTEGTHKITLSVATGGDTNEENNSSSFDFVSYTARPLPYRDSFETPAESALWTSVNSNADAAAWSVEEGYEFDGKKMAVIAGSNEDHDDWLISPAISLTEGYDGRLSFYYGSTGDKDSADLKVYLTRSNTPAGAADSDPLLSLSCGAAGVNYASAPVNGLEAGNYYLAFHADGGKRDLLIDDVRLDDNAEIAVVGLSVTNPEPAYDHEPSTVRLTLHNYGRQPVSGAKAAYTLYKYHVNSAVPQLVETVQETVATPIPAGEDFVYSFEKQLTYPEEASYLVKAAFSAPDGTDADDKNNSFQTNASQRLVTMHAPALWDMEISDALAGYTFDEAGAWKVGMTNPYDGTRSLFHLGNLADESGDLVVLNRVHLTPGTYDFSFFWQTTRGMSDDSYKQSLDVVMGSSPADMSKVIYSIVDRTAHDKKHSKELVEVTVDTEGYYYFGFNLRKGAAQGLIAIDNVRIEQPLAKYDLTAAGARYEADFDTRANEWQHYHPNASFAQQWTKETDSKLGFSYMQAVEFTSLDVHYTASYLQAPALAVREGCTYSVTLYPEFLGLAQTGKPLTGTEAIVIYRSSRDVPGEFTEIGRAMAKDANSGYTVTFTPEESGLCYLSLLPYCESDAAFRVHSFAVEMTAEAEEGNWEAAGTCSFTDPLFSAFGFDPQTMTDIVFERNTEVKDRYRLVKPYATLTIPENKKSEYSFTESKMTPIVFDIIDNKYVYVYPFNTGWSVNSSDMKGEISGFMNAKNLLENELNFEQIIALAPGCLATLDYDRIVATATFPYYGYEEPPVFLAHVSEVEGNFAANLKGEFMITLPEDMIPDPNEGWETVGTATMTEVFVSGCYGGMESQQLECELQWKESNPDIYRLVNPYASWQNPDETAFSYDSGRPRYMVIHAEDPDHAWFEEFITGVTATQGGMITGQCYAADFVASLTLEKAIATAGDSFGQLLAGNEFSFASATCKYQGRELPTVFTRFADTPKSLTRCNADNRFKVVFHFGNGAVDDVVIDFDGETEYYSLQGHRLQKPTPGQPVIVRQGTHTYKAIFR